MRSFAVAVLGSCLAAAACTSAPFPTAPDRPLFRLATARVADGASAEPRTAGGAAPSADDAPAAPAPSAAPGAAYTTSIRLVRPDGTILTAPRLTAYAGQHANIQILNQSAYVQDFDVETVELAFVADPVIGLVHEGVFLDLVVVPAPGRAGEAALGLRLRSVSLRKPIGTREFTIPGAPGAAPVTIQTPRTEQVEVAGAQRLRLGQETEWARVPDPSGGEDLRLLGRVDTADVAALDPPEIDPAGAGGAALTGDGAPPDAATTFLGEKVRPPTPPGRTESETLRRLADAASGAGSMCGEVRLVAVRMRAGVADAAAPGVERLGELSLRTVVGEGARISDTLSEAHLADWEVGDAPTGPDAAPADPVVGLSLAGLEADFAADASIRIRWTTVARFDTFTTLLGRDQPVGIDVPWTVTSTRTVALTPGRAVHPMFQLADGGTAAILVEFTPDQPR